MPVSSLSESLESAVKKHKRILVVIKGSPDPDAIASAFAFKAVSEFLGAETDLISLKNLSLPQNREFVRLLDIPVSFDRDEVDIRDYDAYAVLDNQSASVERITGKIPCVVHIDHHEPFEEDITADFKYINQDAGSTSSMMALLIRDLKPILDPDTMKKIATALVYGIQTDTDKYSYATKIDYDALRYISAYYDSGIINRISEIPLSETTIRLLNEAIHNQTEYKGWLVSGIGFLDSSARDSIPIIADFLLKRGEQNTVVVFGVVEDHDKKKMMLDASFRSTEEHLNLDDIIKEITPEGGGRKYKGAFQINLDFFSYCPERVLLWDIVKLTAIERIKNRRDGLYITELKGVYKRLRKSLRDFFSS
jgi:nanoRNase/pAp phosphatase (c-di-AMP/oligoRNAs hydrolase)